MSEATSIDTQVFCLLSDSKIAARECVDQQHGNRCFCPKAPSAIVAISAVALPGSKLAEAISTCKDRAQSMLKRPSAERFDGPAARKLRGEAEPSSLIQGELPAAPEPSLAKRTKKLLAELEREVESETEEERAPSPMKPWLPPAELDDIDEDLERRAKAQAKPMPEEVARAIEATRSVPGWETFMAGKTRRRAAVEAEEEPSPPPAICSAPGCRTALRVNNLTRLCRLHRNKVSSRKRDQLVPSLARAAGTAGNAIDSEKQMEERMAATKGRTCTSCGKKLRIGRNGQEHEQCSRCRLKGEVAALPAPEKKPRKAKAPKKLPRKMNGKKHKALAGNAHPPPAAVSNGVAPPELGKPIEFKDLPAIETLPVAYLIACAEHLAIARRRIDFALAGQPYLAPRAAES